jgi:hypothetical protein
MGFLTLKAPAIEPVTVQQLISYAHLDSNEDPAMLSMLLVSAREWCEEFCKRAFVFQTKRLLMDFFPGAINPHLIGETIRSPFISGSNPLMAGLRFAILLPWPSARQVITLTYRDPNDDSQSMAPGTDFIADLDSRPARLTPLFDNYWPVTRIIVNAINVDYVTGWSGPITVSIVAGGKLLTSSLNFLQQDVGSPISIPNAGTGGTALVTTIVAVSATGQASVADAAAVTVTNQATTFGAIPQSVQQAILTLAAQYYETRLPGSDDVPFGVRALLYPWRDVRL